MKHLLSNSSTNYYRPNTNTISAVSNRKRFSAIIFQCLNVGAFWSFLDVAVSRMDWPVSATLQASGILRLKIIRSRSSIQFKRIVQIFYLWAVHIPPKKMIRETCVPKRFLVKFKSYLKLGYMHYFDKHLTKFGEEGVFCHIYMAVFLVGIRIMPGEFYLKFRVWILLKLATNSTEPSWTLFRGMQTPWYP